MSCNIKRIKGCEIAGSTFNGRKLSLNRDFSKDTFKAKVKTFNQKTIAEITGVKNATDVYFPFNGLENLSAGLYIIEYWGNFEDIGNELFCIEEFNVVAPSKAGEVQCCDNYNVFNFEIKIEEISIPVTITKSINNFYLNIDNLTPEQIALIKGEKGDKGDKGEKGEAGEKGEQGNPGDKGSNGNDGASAYEIAVTNGFSGTESQWLSSLKGEKGEQGVQGEKGEKGDKGDKGDAFTYEDFTPEQIAELQKPATDKEVELNALEENLTNSESLRVQNENTRISAENTRNTNDQTRVNAENNRISAETSRVSAENSRTASETERIANENLRKTAETSRSNAENTRISAENSRVTAESSRVTAENARVAAELERQNKKKSFTHDILMANWNLVSGKYEAVISNAGILANSFVDIIPINDNVDIVRSAQIYPSVLISEGSVKVYSKFLPSGTISVTVNVI